MAFAALADFEFYIGEALDGIDIGRADQLLALAAAKIKRDAGQVLELVTDDEVTLDGSEGIRLYLPEAPVVSVTSVVQDGDTVDVADYVVSSIGVLTRLTGTWGAKPQSVVVTYTHGYATIPADLKLACLELARRGFTLDRSGVVTAESLDNYSTSFASGDSGLQLANSAVDPEAIAKSYRPVVVA